MRAQQLQWPGFGGQFCKAYFAQVSMGHMRVLMLLQQHAVPTNYARGFTTNTATGKVIGSCVLATAHNPAREVAACTSLSRLKILPGT